jgi:hypothetical protein
VSGGAGPKGTIGRRHSAFRWNFRQSIAKDELDRQGLDHALNGSLDLLGLRDGNHRARQQDAGESEQSLAHVIL